MWRALGAGMKVCFLQFLKGGLATSEANTAARFAPQLFFLNPRHPYSEALMAGNPSQEDRRCALDTWELARAALGAEEYELVVLDEINNALHLGLAPLQEVLETLRRRPQGQEVICTGRHAPPELLEMADLVTEMVAVKHPFDHGQGPRQGIEF
jgi:cob(I)alamin adenosyltransferase